MNWKRSPRKPAREDAVNEEIGFHIAELTEDYIARGMSPEEARRRALLEFGGREQVKQQLREVHISPVFEGFAFNLKAAMRFLRKSPSFSIVVILTLALGIGANSAVFSAIDAIILRPLPFPHSNQLVALYQHDYKGRDANVSVAPVRLEDWNRLNSTFLAISGYYFDDLSETSGSLPEKVTECLVAPRFLEVMGVSPMLGREFTAQEEHWGGSNSALISYTYWQRHFHGDPGAVGQKLHIGDYSYAIVGVMPSSFQFPKNEVDVWTPSAPDAPFAQRRDETWFTVIGRMKPGVALEKATADLATVQSRLGKQFPKPDAELTVQIAALKDVIIGESRSSLWLLYGSVSLLLLIACSNIAALLLARTTEREHEVSIRFSLGASRSAIVGQLLTEVFGLALLGSLAGLLVAAASARGFHLLSKTLPRADEIGLNWQIVGYTLVAAVLTTLLCGLFPALRGTRRTLARSLAAGGRTQVSTRGTLQWMLVGMQIMLAVTLLIGAGLLLRSFQQLARVHPGFEPSHVLTFQVSGSWGETSEMKNVIQRIDRTLESLRALPGVEAASTAAMLPGVPSQYQIEFKIDGKLEPGHPILADSRYVSAGYFETMRIPLLMGESCRQASKTSDILVNRAFADRYMGNTLAVGHQLSGAIYNDFLPQGTIRGVVGDAREEGMSTQAAPTVYSCFSAPDPFPNYLVRTHGDPMAMAETIRRRIHEIEPARSVYAFAPLQEHLDEASQENRLRTMLLTVFAATAILLACIGLYGTLSYLGRLRQREVGVRLALGAMRSQIVARFLLQGLRVAVIGCAAGLVLGLGLSHFIGSMLYGVSSVDPATYGGVVCLILVVAACASLVPALRAARVEPVQVLREE
ncbi:MAG TPA: ABC transporter permease [Terracidiphilus sp.]|nr:ABC transporter permease [Terracidiphilus sp.]